MAAELGGLGRKPSFPSQSADDPSPPLAASAAMGIQPAKAPGSQAACVCFYEEGQGVKQQSRNGKADDKPFSRPCSNLPMLLQQHESCHLPAKPRWLLTLGSQPLQAACRVCVRCRERAEEQWPPQQDGLLRKYRKIRLLSSIAAFFAVKRVGQIQAFSRGDSFK